MAYFFFIDDVATLTQDSDHVFSEIKVSEDRGEVFTENTQMFTLLSFRQSSTALLCLSICPIPYAVLQIPWSSA